MTGSGGEGCGGDGGGGGARGGHHRRARCDSRPDLSSGQDEWEEKRKKGGQINKEQWPRAEERSREWMEMTREGGGAQAGLFGLFSAVTPRTRQEG